VGIASLLVPGVTPQRSLLVPSEPDPSVLAFDGTPGYRGQCIEVTAQAICDPSYSLSGEEDVAIERHGTVAERAGEIDHVRGELRHRDRVGGGGGERHGREKRRGRREREAAESALHALAKVTSPARARPAMTPRASE